MKIWTFDEKKIMFEYFLKYGYNETTTIEMLPLEFKYGSSSTTPDAIEKNKC